jgi:hypothetical protein
MPISKKEFIEWLLSDGPFDQQAYGANISRDEEWVAKIKAARIASGLYRDDLL